MCPTLRSRVHCVLTGSYEPNAFATKYNGRTQRIGRPPSASARKAVAVDSSPGPGAYGEPNPFATKYKGRSQRIGPPPSPSARKAVAVDSSPGPGAYFETGARGETYGEINRFGNRSLARHSAAWAKSVGRHATSEQRGVE